MNKEEKKLQELLVPKRKESLVPKTKESLVPKTKESDYQYMNISEAIKKTELMKKEGI